MNISKLRLLPIAVALLVWQATPAHAAYLTFGEIDRLKAVKVLLADVDTKPLEESIAQLERSKHPLLDLQMKEAMAHAYTDIVRDYRVTALNRKQWLYSMVCLNMAYLQFGGGPSGTTSLNRLICQKIKEYLPPGFLQQVNVSLG